MNRRIVTIIIGCVFVITIFALALSKIKKTGKDESLSVRAGVPNMQMSADELFALAQQREDGNDLIKAQEAYDKILSHYPEYPNIEDVQKKMEEINMKIIFSPSVIGPNAKYYDVRPGDNLSKIAHKFGTTVGMIKRINGLKSDVIRPRMRLKIWTGKFSVLVDKSQNILMLKSNDRIVRTYTVATGKNGSTPTGKLVVVNKLVDPVWFKPGVSAVVPSTSPENVLGSRWMGLNISGYGIHGTKDDGSLGLQVTEGCVRMSNKDAEELYSILPLGSEVEIID
ncbi:MAG: L,D-transpeptidase family protein [Candidatus Omnitrophota bacterium]